jgi:hypothetical protein
MDATSNFRLRFAQALGSKARLPERLLKRAALQRIATGLSLISQAVGFSIIGVLILATRHQAELNDSANGSLRCYGRRHQRSFCGHRVPYRR